VPPMLEDFLRNAAEKGYPEVRIIHGKGRSTLKRVVLEFLDGHPLVESCRDAWDSASGWGATVVKMRDRATR
jgi:DNA-nicking Smr family endonuclease